MADDGKLTFFSQLQKNIETAAKTAADAAADTDVSATSPKQNAAFFQKVAYVNQFNNIPSAEPEKEVGLPRLIRFAEADEDESDNGVFLLDALIYIQGVEVSEYVQGSIQVDKNTIDGHSRVTFVLDNANDRFVWTEANLRDLYGASDPDFIRRNSELNEEERRAATKSKFLPGEEIKKDMYAYKADPKLNPRVRNAKNTSLFARFDLAPNRACINRMDPIRVFTLYPFRVPGQVVDATKKNYELWMPEFAGFVKNVSIEDDDIRGRSTVTIEATDITDSVLHRMRIGTDISLNTENALDSVGFANNSTATAGDLGSPGENITQPINPAVAELQNQALSESDRFYNPDQTQFYDDVIASGYGQPFPKLPMEQAVANLLVFKQTRLQTNQGNRGVRNVELGGTFNYDQDQDRQARQNFLQNWHKFCLFGPKGRPWTRAEVETVGKGTKLDGTYNPNNVRLWFLLPKEGSGSKNTADLGHFSNNSVNAVNWTTRLEVLKNLVASIDYRMFISPTGDFICEFPMADFRPEDFGEFKDTFRINKGLIQSNFGDEQDEPIAGLILTHGFGDGATIQTDPAAVAAATYTKVFVFSPYIAGRYGVTTEVVQVPSLLANEKALAQQRAIIEFQKLNARCNALNMSFTYRPFILPNRPLHHLRRTRIGLTVSVNSTFNFGSQPKAETSVGLEHVRQWTGHFRSAGDLALKEPQLREMRDGGVTNHEAYIGVDPLVSPDRVELQVFTNVMAGESTPLSARMAWGTNDKGLLAPGSGVYLIDPQDIDKTARANAATNHELNKANVGSTAGLVARPHDPALVKFSHNPITSIPLRRTSPFGLRTDPIKGGQKFHHGMDFGAPSGTPVVAVQDGTIVALGRGVPGADGIAISLDTSNNYNVLYMHLSAVETKFKPGDSVTGGTVIGYVGNTGKRSTGPHLHIQTRKKGANNEDPEPLFPGPIFVGSGTRTPTS
jgi:murein DD-endopeptidase MepM/ murein hydrolase activator NlpD